MSRPKSFQFLGRKVCPVPKRHIHRGTSKGCIGPKQTENHISKSSSTESNCSALYDSIERLLATNTNLIYSDSDSGSSEEESDSSDDCKRHPNKSNLNKRQPNKTNSNKRQPNRTDKYKRPDNPSSTSQKSFNKSCDSSRSLNRILSTLGPIQVTHTTGAQDCCAQSTGNQECCTKLNDEPQKSKRGTGNCSDVNNIYEKLTTKFQKHFACFDEELKSHLKSRKERKSAAPTENIDIKKTVTCVLSKYFPKEDPCKEKEELPLIDCCPPKHLSRRCYSRKRACSRRY